LIVTPYSNVTNTSKPQWLYNWWGLHRDEFPQMAAATRDYLAIPASEMAVERLFNIRRRSIRNPQVFHDRGHNEDSNVTK
jgi:hypothetical protein